MITSRDNPRLKHLRRLIDDKAYRYECGEYVVEGPRALSACQTVKELFVASGTQAPAGRQETPVIVEASLFAALAPTENTQGVLAVMPLRVSGPDAIRADGRYVLLDRLQDPGNAGTIIRTACAFGMDGVIVTPGCVDVFAPKVVRSSAGLISALPVIRCDAPEVPGACPVFALAADGRDVRDVRWPASFILAVGSEAQGISPALRARANTIVGIPMHGPAESLNAAIAAGIALFAATNQPHLQ